MLSFRQADGTWVVRRGHCHQPPCRSKRRQPIALCEICHEVGNALADRHETRLLELSKTQKPTVVIYCDARCEMRQYFQVVNALKEAGIENYFQEVESNNGKAGP